MNETVIGPLLARLREGDEEAAGHLFARARRPLLAFFHRLCGDADQADDLLQNTLFSLWKYRENYRATGTARSYVHRVAINTWHALVAETVRQRRIQDALERDLPEQACESGVADIERDELRARVWSAIESLPRPQRQAVVLHRFAGMKCREIAVTLDLPRKTVESRLRLAYEKLTTKLRVVGEGTR